MARFGAPPALTFAYHLSPVIAPDKASFAQYPHIKSKQTERVPVMRTMNFGYQRCYSASKTALKA